MIEVTDKLTPDILQSPSFQCIKQPVPPFFWNISNFLPVNKASIISWDQSTKDMNKNYIWSITECKQIKQKI